MKKIITETVLLESLVPGGQALGQLADGKKVFVWGALAGETVIVQLTKNKQHYAEAVATEIIDPSPERITPRDECYLSTSPWQIMTEDAENRHKTNLIEQSFKQEGIDIKPNPIKSDGNFWHYRNKMEYSLWWDHDTAKIWPAFHRRGSHQKMLVKTSSIERPEIWQEAQRVINELNKNGDQARRYQSLMIRCNQQGEVRSALFEMNKPHPKMTNLTDQIMGREYSYSPNGFFQINLPVYNIALADMQKFIIGEKVVDMYSGVGTIGLSIARNKYLTLVETDKHAFAEMINNIPNKSAVKAVQAKSEEALDYIVSDATIIVDPPRAGLDQKVIDRLLQVSPHRIIYLSCNPATQARDIKMLLDDYVVTHTQPYNFFPRTPHIENLVILTKK